MCEEGSLFLSDDLSHLYSTQRGGTASEMRAGGEQRMRVNKRYEGRTEEQMTTGRGIEWIRGYCKHTDSISVSTLGLAFMLSVWSAGWSCTSTRTTTSFVDLCR
jgi:hypothetical protein